MPSPPIRGVYSPLISSPLNPDGHADIPRPRNPPKNSKTLPTNTAAAAAKRLKSYHNLSPTQMLLRKKAEEAWKSIKESAGADDDGGNDGGRRARRRSRDFGSMLRDSSYPRGGEKRQPTWGARVSIIQAHWEEAEKAEHFFFDSGSGGFLDADDCDGDDDEEDGQESCGRKSGFFSLRYSVVNLRPSRFLFRDATRRMALLVAGLVCIGGCLPVLAIMTVVGGKAPVRQWFPAATSKPPSFPPPFLPGKTLHWFWERLFPTSHNI